MSDEEHASLLRAARRHSVPPSTLARILVVRAVKVALERGR